ncbi:MAG TPA: multiheme c-type cytochrome [Acidobacteriota bacterium]|nr:multiheme c-type cytochrome [Acidobacteriota bacterium]
MMKNRPILTTALMSLAAFCIDVGIAGSEPRLAVAHQESRVSLALGSQSCAAPVCHGSSAAYAEGEVRRDEYGIWSSRDRHARAYSVLLDETARRMAANLGIGPAHKAGLCLDCHAFNPPAAQRSELLRVTEGVGCEACHGASSLWLGSHVSADGGRAALGMDDHTDVETRAVMCLSCHQGDATKSVDHRLIAAGHPMLEFELDTFEALMPRHWKATEDNWAGVRRWATGQAVALRESMRQLQRRASRTGWSQWPEFADFECSSCHHSLIVYASGEDFQPSPRQRRGFSSTPGLPPWDPSRAIVLRQLLAVAQPGRSAELDEEVKTLRDLLRSPRDNRVQVADQARRIADLADGYAESFKTLQANAQMVRAVLTQLASQSSAISDAGRRSAQQATMAADALYASYRHNAGGSAEVDAIVNRLYLNLQSSPAYDPASFGQILRELESGLR